MAKNENEILFVLIKSLTKAEKRYFKLFANRNSNEKELKFVLLFNALDKMSIYDEVELREKVPTIKVQQLSNTKALLYKSILRSIRQLEVNQNDDIEIRENIDYARVLYNKGLYKQSLKILDKIKQKALARNEDVLRLEIIDFEKLIEGQYITRSMGNRAEVLTREAIETTNVITRTQEFSNLSLSLYGFYLKLGSVRNAADYQVVNRFFYRNLPKYNANELSFFERLYLYQAMVWYHYIILDFVKCYRYAQLWVNLFHSNPEMKANKPDLYVKGLHNLLAALFNIQHYPKFLSVLQELEQLRSIDFNQNINSLIFLYSYNNKINRYFMEGRFSEGLYLVPELLVGLEKLEAKLDSHRRLLFYYKIACLYFGAGDNKSTVKYLNMVINFKDVSLREDIHCFARILNIIAHFELGNLDLLEYQIKSTYRFLVKMNNLQKVQIEIIKWLKLTPKMLESELKSAFIQLKNKLEEIANEPFEIRPYLYLDIISWLESKIEHKTVQEIIRRKFLKKNNI
jgi:hypothetical protein